MNETKPSLPDVGAQRFLVGRIAAYIVAARERPAAGLAREVVFSRIFDLLGAAAAGVGDRAANATRATALMTMGAGSVPIWFTGQSSTVIGAAWANSAAASALDLDDGHRLAQGHPGAAVIPTAFAVAQETGATLEDLISAIVIGYEVGVTIGAARVTFGSTGTWSSYAVVATAAVLRRTPGDILAHALAIAGEEAPNQLAASAPKQIEGSKADVKEGIPWSVVTGMLALGLAEAGFTGPLNVLDNAQHYCFPDAFSPGSAQHICKSYTKLYSCCRYLHAPIDALLHLVNQHGIDPHSIDAIEVEIHSTALRLANLARPMNLIEVQYSIPYCMALAVIVGPQALLPLTTEALFRDDVAALAEKVTLRPDPAFDSRFPAETLARVAVTCGGHHLVSDVTAPRGEATTPLSWADLEAKFMAATRLVATGAEQSRVIRAMNDARAGNLSALTDCLEGLALVRSN